MDFIVIRFVELEALTVYMDHDKISTNFGVYGTLINKHLTDSKVDQLMPLLSSRNKEVLFRE